MATKKRGRFRVGVALFLGGNLVFAVGAWLPWTTLIGYTGANTATYFDPGRASNLPLLGALGDPQSVLAAWSLLTILGLALAPLLTVRWPRWLVQAGHVLSGLWLLLATVVAVALLIGLASGSYIPPIPCPPQLVCARPAMSSMPDVGFFLAPLGLLVAWIGWALTTSSVWRSWVSALERPRATFAEHRFENTLFVTGLIIWALGFYSMPWITRNCGHFTLVIGECTGINASGAVLVGLESTGTAFDPQIATYALPFLLALGALELFYLLTRGGLCTAVSRLWTAAWIVLALVIAHLALSGVGSIAHNPTRVGLPTGAWTGDLGIVAGAFGLVLLTIGLVVSFATARWRPDAPSSPITPS